MNVLTKVLIVNISVAAVYVGCFYLLMVPNCRAYDSDDKPAFNNCPRFSESVRVPGPLSIYTGRANFLNYIYYPFEFIYRGPQMHKKPIPAAGTNAPSPKPVE